MKTTSFFLCCMLMTFFAFSQTKNRLSFFYSPAANGVDIKEDWIGDMGHTGKGANLFELTYSRSVNSFFSVETGLQYAHHKIETEFFPDGVSHYKKSEINMVTIPISGNLTFLKYFFAEAGPTFDFELSRSSSASVNNQSGIGLAFGVGGKYTFRKITLMVNPFFQRHLLLSLGSGETIEHLWQSGIKFGIGYDF